VLVFLRVTKRETGRTRSCIGNAYGHCVLFVLQQRAWNPGFRVTVERVENATT